MAVNTPKIRITWTSLPSTEAVFEYLYSLFVPSGGLEKYIASPSSSPSSPPRPRASGCPGADFAPPPRARPFESRSPVRHCNWPTAAPGDMATGRRRGVGGVGGRFFRFTNTAAILSRKLYRDTRTAVPTPPSANKSKSKLLFFFFTYTPYDRNEIFPTERKTNVII